MIPPKGTPSDLVIDMRRRAGEQLVQQQSVFDGLRKQNISETGDGEIGKASGGATTGSSAEQHLIDMLCASGFQSEETWSRRYIEPQKTCIVSLALAMLNPSDTTTALATSQKLLLFWRKPARKCWWASMPLENGIEVKAIKVWARRVWTLELSIIG